MTLASLLMTIVETDVECPTPLANATPARFKATVDILVTAEPMLERSHQTLVAVTGMMRHLADQADLQNNKYRVLRLATNTQRHY